MDTTDTGIKNLSKGIIPTGNNQLDDILLTYGFDSVKISSGYLRHSYLSVYTDNYYNLLPIVNEFEALPCISIAESSGWGGDGNNIFMTRDKHKVTINFSIGRGDCPAGCTARRMWVFEIRNNKDYFIRSYGNAS